MVENLQEKICSLNEVIASKEELVNVIAKEKANLKLACFEYCEETQDLKEKIAELKNEVSIQINNASVLATKLKESIAIIKELRADTNCWEDAATSFHLKNKKLSKEMDDLIGKAIDILKPTQFLRRLRQSKKENAVTVLLQAAQKRLSKDMYSKVNLGDTIFVSLDPSRDARLI